MDSDPRPRTPPWGGASIGPAFSECAANVLCCKGIRSAFGLCFGNGGTRTVHHGGQTGIGATFFCPSPGGRCGMHQYGGAWARSSPSPCIGGGGMGLLGPCRRHGHGRGTPIPGTGIRSHASLCIGAIQASGIRTRGRDLFRSRGETDRFFGKSLFHSLTRSGMPDTLCPDSHPKRRKP